MRRQEWETKDIEKAVAAVHPRGWLQAAQARIVVREEMMGLYSMCYMGSCQDLLIN